MRMPDQIIHVPLGHLNISPALFRRHARQYLACHRAFKPDTPSSPVPYFLLCRSIELSLKAKHLESLSRKQVKKEYGHNLAKLYYDLQPGELMLEAAELQTLNTASAIYDIPNKGFEYVSVYDAVTGLDAFPELSILENIAVKALAE